MNEKPSDESRRLKYIGRSHRRWNGPQPVVLALGANQGERRTTFERAYVALCRQGIHVVRASRLFETRPLAGSAGPAYLNGCLEVRTSLMPHQLLRRCQGIERELGRKRERRWGARALDIDLIAYGRERIHTPALTLPHPRWFERDFILWGLRDLDCWIDPATPAAEAARFRHWLGSAEKCILTAYPWPLPVRPR